MVYFQTGRYEKNTLYGMAQEEDEKRKFILLLRSPTEGGIDQYHKTLESGGYNPVSVPVLKFNFINIDEYSDRLSNLTSYHSIVFTSQQAVKATQEVIQSWKEGKQSELAKSLTCYVVGKATSNTARQLGFSPNGENSGNADNLCDYILLERDESEERPILFPCSNIRKDTIIERLCSKGIPVEELNVYETVHRDEITDEIKRLVNKYGKPFAVVFFSPSGVQALKKNNLLDI
ncbi:uroporphyrinogen-III synthase [Mytilus galloprovincialis]|uniref:Uroporphyrinogen-III synthase n=1 Tax=Mytilus galloprovincialis TaxID=29158 RepID=A0A8B6FVZ8_MYTGA|nr:uroporphyrinogen-III synthase [Mytilus galloprovincialis]